LRGRRVRLPPFFLLPCLSFSLALSFFPFSFPFFLFSFLPGMLPATSAAIRVTFIAPRRDKRRSSDGLTGAHDWARGRGIVRCEKGDRERGRERERYAGDRWYPKFRSYVSAVWRAGVERPRRYLRQERGAIGDEEWRGKWSKGARKRNAPR